MPAPSPSPEPHSSPSSAETKRRLIEAGLEVFGRYGFEPASTRQLAQAAGVNLAAIPYHFGSKEGLYRAVIEHICGTVIEALGEAQRKVFAVVENPGATRDEILGAIEQIIRNFGRMVNSQALGGQFGPIVMREQLQPSGAYDILYDREIGPLHSALTRLVARLEDKAPETDAVIIRTHAILGQVVAFRAMREAALRRLGWKGMSEEQIERIGDVIVENCRRILAGEADA